MLRPSQLRGKQRRACYDNFLIECRANGSLINQQKNGKFTPFCYGWITIPTAVEIYVARKFNIQPFLWDRPPDASKERVRAILFEWVDGKMLSQVQINSEIANEIRTALKGLHQASIAHGDVRAANILVNDDRVYLIDLNASLTLPHIKISAQKLKERQERELRDLEIGFALLSEVPINQGACVADMSLVGQSSLGEILSIYDLTKHHWWPPRPTCWQDPSLTRTKSIGE
jgi:serine/threonine protein kinase